MNDVNLKSSAYAKLPFGFLPTGGLQRVYGACALVLFFGTLRQFPKVSVIILPDNRGLSRKVEEKNGNGNGSIREWTRMNANKTATAKGNK